MPQAFTVCKTRGIASCKTPASSSAQTLGSRCSAHHLRPCAKACPILARLSLPPVVEASTTPSRPGPGPQGRNALSARRVGWGLPVRGTKVGTSRPGQSWLRDTGRTRSAGRGIEGWRVWLPWARLSRRRAQRWDLAGFGLRCRSGGLAGERDQFGRVAVLVTGRFAAVRGAEGGHGAADGDDLER